MNNDDYVVIQGWMINELHLKGGSLMAYALVYSYTREDGSWFHGSARYVADWMGCSRKATAIDALKSLVEKGLIEKRSTVVDNVKLCEYRAVPRPGTETVPGVVRKPYRGGTETVPNKYIDKDIDIESLFFTSNGNGNENLEHVTGNNSGYDFEAIWKDYPRKEGKHKAKAACDKAVREGVSPDLIHEKVKEYARYVSNREQKFIAIGSTWFGQRRWEDVYPDTEGGGAVDFSVYNFG